ncbi:hypothetical protein I656_03255 [Geobacillus sp. WSUCF1]|nr:hypothetical protein I656_03255 [Geobacillus sp. WSUCF1]
MMIERRWLDPRPTFWIGGSLLGKKADGSRNKMASAGETSGVKEPSSEKRGTNDANSFPHTVDRRHRVAGSFGLRRTG